MKRGLFYRLGSYKFINYWFVFEELVRIRGQRGSWILDAGCGKGASIISPPDGVYIVGIDILRDNVIASKRKWVDRSFVVGDLLKLPFVEGAFGGAISANVLEHVSSKILAVEELARVTNELGFFAGCSTNILNPVLWLDVKFPIITKPFEKKLADPGHYGRHSRFSPSSLENTLLTAGYRLDYLSILGLPQFSHSPIKPWIAYLWILFDKLTNMRMFSIFKEMLVWQATKAVF